MQAGKILREILSEPGNGTLSFGRVASGLALLFCFGWATYVLVHTHVIPPLAGLTGFALAPFAANKAANAAQAFSSNPVDATPNPTQVPHA